MIGIVVRPDRAPNGEMMSSPPARVRRAIFRFSIVCKDARVFGLSFAPSRVDRVVSELSLYRLRSAF
jgi:hypothetical protein